MSELEPQPIDKTLLDRKEAMRAGVIQRIRATHEQWWNFSLKIGQFEGRDVLINNGDLLRQESELLEVRLSVPRSELESVDFPIVETWYGFSPNADSLGSVSETEYIDKVPRTVPMIISKEFNIHLDIPDLPFILVGHRIRSKRLTAGEFQQVSGVLWELLTKLDRGDT